MSLITATTGATRPGEPIVADFCEVALLPATSADECDLILRELRTDIVSGQNLSGRHFLLPIESLATAFSFSFLTDGLTARVFVRVRDGRSEVQANFLYL
jgi:hypothetical protein